MRNKFLFVIMLIITCDMVMSCGRSRSTCRGRNRPVPDTTPPRITCPPDKTEFADPFQVNTKVSWDEGTVVAIDDRDGNVQWTRSGRAPGKIFSEGTTRITYSARDKSGNSASCYLTITVIVKKCAKWGPIDDGWKICHVSHDEGHVRRGSVCRFGCYSGHDLVGPSRSTCQDNEAWDIPAQPYCQKLQCPLLLKSPEQFDVVDIECTDENYFRSKCSYNCVPGYSVLPGYSKVQICDEFGSWLGSVPQCLDTEPPTYVTCPYVVTTYAERSKTTGRDWWNPPQAQDNSGDFTTIQISGPAPGTDLEVGEHAVSYISYDAANNTAICKFNVVVKQIKCHHIYPLPYTNVVCPTGRIYGSTCEFSCDNGTVINGNRYAECVKDDVSVVPYGVWTFDNYQPYCEQQETCPALQAPDNGTLACNTWMSGRFCQMLCKEGYWVIDDVSTDIDEASIHKTLLVCGDSGVWHMSDDIPGCVKVSSDRLWMLFSARLEYLYFTGDCEGNKDEIKYKFIATVSEGLGDLCTPDTCNVNTVTVICGPVTDGDINKRDTSEVLSLGVSVELPEDMEPDNLALLKSDVGKALDTAIQNGDLDHDGIRPIFKSDIQGGCNDGSAFDERTFMCVECATGRYYNSTYDACLQCQRGSYQDEDRQTSCKVCPEGQTTAKLGASSLSQCQDACEAGYYSDTGIEPCSPCDLGTYSTQYGSTECTHCPGSQITLMSSATSVTQCQEFDITYTVIDAAETAIPALLPGQFINSTNGITVELWVKCTSCDNILEIIDTDGTQIMHVGDRDQLKVTFLGIEHETGESVVGSDTWKRITVSCHSGKISVYIDGTESFNEDYTNQLTPFRGNITIGGDGFVGSISQFNIWSAADLNSAVSTESCFMEEPGDLVAWKQFSEVDGTFTLTKSKCDAIDDCLNSPCQNGGSCTDGINTFSCACAVGFVGSTCSINTDDCEDNVCGNGGTCVDGVGEYTCQCPYGFNGEFCEIQYVDGGWTEWVTTGQCSVTCGSGVQNRTRACENPEPSNGGKPCEGNNVETVECDTYELCAKGCLTDPPDIVNGDTNCSWTSDKNDTRVCHPFCNDGYLFDDVLFVETSGVRCGPDTGYTWNINTTVKPNLNLPSCSKKEKAIGNIIYMTAEYPTLTDTQITPALAQLVKQTVNQKMLQQGCLSTSQCKHIQTMVSSSGSTSGRRKRETSSVVFTIEISCDISNDMDECYDLLSFLLLALEDLIEQKQLTIQYDGTDHDVGFNTSSYDGLTTCLPGYIPVWQYCVACGKGTYSYNDYCEVCPVGTYQDLEAQTSCKSCPDDWSTLGHMTRDKNECNVHIPSTDEASYALVIGVAVGGSLLVVIAAVIVIAILCKKKGNPAQVDPSVHLSPAMVMDNANKRFHSYPGFAANKVFDPKDDFDESELYTLPPDFRAKSGSTSPPPAYDNIVRSKSDVNIDIRPSTAYSMDPITVTSLDSE